MGRLELEQPWARVIPCGVEPLWSHFGKTAGARVGLGWIQSQKCCNKASMAEQLELD